MTGALLDRPSLPPPLVRNPLSRPAIGGGGLQTPTCRFRKLENIGTIKKMVHPAAKSGVQRNKAFVITGSSTLASIDLTSGAIAWRQVSPHVYNLSSVVSHTAVTYLGCFGLYWC